MRISDWSSDVCSSDLCAAFVLAFVSVAGQRFDFGRIAVGWDLRPSSPRIAAAVMAAVRAAGLEAECCGMLPTPALALHAITQRIPAVMVTGGHIPFDRDGLKFYRPDGAIARTRFVYGKSVSVRVDIGGRRIIKKKKKNT